MTNGTDKYHLWKFPKMLYVFLFLFVGNIQLFYPVVLFISKNKLYISLPCVPVFIYSLLECLFFSVEMNHLIPIFFSFSSVLRV